MPSTIRQNKIQDGVDDTLLVEVNSSKELKVKDTDLETLSTSANTKLDTINTSIEDVEASADETTAAVAALATQEELTGLSVKEMLSTLVDQSKLTNMYLSYIANIKFTEQDI